MLDLGVLGFVGDRLLDAGCHVEEAWVEEPHFLADDRGFGDVGAEEVHDIVAVISALSCESDLDDGYDVGFDLFESLCCEGGIDDSFDGLDAPAGG